MTLSFVNSAEIKKMRTESGEEGQRGRENRRKGISVEGGCVRVEKNAKQKRKRVKT